MVEIKIKNDSEQFIKQFKDDINKYAKFYEDGSGPWWGFESTWLIDKNDDISLVSEDYKYSAWFRIYKDNENVIKFGIIGSTKVKMTVSLYAHYHSKLSEYLLMYYDEEIEHITISPKLTKDIDFYG